ncbi:MAG: CsiV family protein [Xanthomonadales bacterium]
MIYRIFIIVILILCTSLVRAGEKRYRIEILVLSHLQHAEIPTEAEWLRNFSSSLDFLKLEDKDDEDSDHQGRQDGDLGLATASEVLPGEDRPEDPRAAVIAVDGMSDEMRQAWRRLSLSTLFQPEQYLSWEQSANEPFPSLRIHDLEVVRMGDPYADDPTLFYRLDGTVMLRRLRFLHLDLDLELRQAVFDERLLTTLSRGQVREPDPLQADSDEPEHPLPSSFLIHKLKQSRQVKSQRMEYFDSPVLGVLAWISSFELEDEAEDEAAEPGSGSRT